MRTLRYWLSLGFAVAAAFMAVPSAAASATPFHDEFCFEVENGTVCVEGRGVVVVTNTGSGHSVQVQNLRSVQTFTGSGPLLGCNDSNTVSQSSHFLALSDGTVQEVSFRQFQTLDIDCQGFTITCDTIFHFHQANEDVQFLRSEVICE